MEKINYKSDFDFILHLKDCAGNDVGWPTYDWTARFWTTQKVNAFVVSCIGGEAVNCYNDGGRIHVVANNHRLSPGTLQVEFTAEIPNGDYPDSAERIVVPVPLEIELIREAAPCPESFEVEVLLPYIKGEPFTYDDFTPEQIEDLMRPATEAAASANQAVTAAQAATAQAVASNNKLAADMVNFERDESLRAEAERMRVSAETERQSAEDTRQANETARQEAETGRQSAETARVQAESERQEAESGRDLAETERVKAESLRETAEQTRKTSENSRNKAEELRVSAEGTRVSQEAARQTAEQGRENAESARERAESLRETAETERVKAEQERATEFASWETELDAKPDRSELSNILGTPTEEVIEEIEPGIVTDALRKVPQVLTPEEQAQVRENIGVSKMELFIDMWNAAWGEYGKYDPVNAPDPQHPFMGNEIWMTYEEAVISMNVHNGQTKSNYSMLNPQPSKNKMARTIPPIESWINPIICERFASYNTVLEAVRFHTSRNEDVRISDASIGFLEHCKKLRFVFSKNGLKIFSNVSFAGCPKLEFVQLIPNGRYDINLVDSPLISLTSFQFMVSKVTITSGVTITVHPDVYAKLTDESNEEWHQVLLDAAEKNINFATV